MRVIAFLAVVLLALPIASEARIKRSQSAKIEFECERPCSSTGVSKGLCKGWVIEPLACGGADAAFNMQWQTVAEGKAKNRDKWERKGC